MFCMECGTKLPDNAKFCMNCGTKVGAAASDVPAAPVQSEKKMGICSDRSQSMVYVPDVGLFFIQDGKSIVYLPAGAKKCKKAVRKNPNRSYGLYSIAYYDGLLYYWAYFDDGEDTKPYKLMSLDPVTLEKNLVKEYDDPRITTPDDNFKTMAVFGNAYYTLGYRRESGNTLMKISLPEGDISEKQLPDLRSKPLPQDWKEPNGYITLNEETQQKRSYGQFDGYLDNFCTVGGYGFVSLSGGSPCTIRFSLDDPDDFTFMPMDCCTGYKGQGLLTEVDGVLYSVMKGLWCSAFWKTPIVNGVPDTSVKLLDLKAQKLDPHGLNGWWRLGRRIYTEAFYFDLDSEKFFRMPKWAVISACDYAQDNKGGCYVLCGDLYYFPKGWEQSGTDLDGFLMEEFD